MFQVEIFDRQFERVVVPPQLQVTPTRWSAVAVGGPERAEVEFAGERELLWRMSNWLRYTVHIRNEVGLLVWWGYVHEALISLGGLSVGLTLETMYNHVKVVYSYSDADGTPQEATTGAAISQSSIDMFGQKEWQYSAGETDAQAAERLRDTLHGWHRFPMPMTEMGGAGDARAILRCRGWWSLLDWRYYEQTRGRLVFDEGSDTEHAIGWSVGPSTQIGFRHDRIHHLAGQLTTLIPNTRVQVTGSASNNTIYWVTGAPTSPEQDAVVYNSNNMTLEPADDVFDANNGLAFCRSEEMIRLSGFATHNGYFFVNTVDPGGGQIEVNPKTLSADSSTAATVEQGNSLTIEGQVNNFEWPGSSLTLMSYGIKVAQSFAIYGEGWTLYEVMVRVRRVGTPADNFRVRIYSDSAGLPNTVLASGTLPAAEIGEEMAWRTVTLAAPLALNVSTAYWVSCDRVGGPGQAYYVVGLDSTLSDSNGILRIQDNGGVTWTARDPNCDMPYQLWGKEETTSQIREIIEESVDVAAGVEVLEASGVYERQFRDGYTTALDEVSALLEMGTSLGGRLLATVTPGRWFRVHGAPASDIGSDLQVSMDGRLLRTDGQPIARGLLPVGQWARIQGLPAVAALATLSPMFLERVEYDAGVDRHYFEPRGAPSIETMPSVLRQG